MCVFNKQYVKLVSQVEDYGFLRCATHAIVPLNPAKRTTTVQMFICAELEPSRRIHSSSPLESHSNL
jgi:hypothetical protein